MVTDDVVVVHGNGRCVRGRDDLKMDCLKGFEAFSIEQSVSTAEVGVRGRWAFCKLGQTEVKIRSFPYFSAAC
jgi:hypothetical protein